jgi:hypothetical protein
MKRFLVFLGWAVAGGALGALSSTFLFRFWFKLGWREPVANWLAARGLGRVAGYWGLAWVYLPDWSIISLVSVVAALLVRRQLLPKITLFCVSFALVPWCIAVASGFNFSAFGPRALLRIGLWNFSVIAVGIALAVSVSTIRKRLTNAHQRGFELSAANHPS